MCAFIALEDADVAQGATYVDTSVKHGENVVLNFYIYLHTFIYLAVLALSCSVQNLYLWNENT